MFCNKCKIEISQEGKFCPNCGGKLTSAITASKSTSLMQYIDSNIKSKTTFVTAQDFMSAAKPKLIKWRWFVICIAGLVTIPALGMGALVAWLISYFSSGILLSKMNLKKYSIPNEIKVDLDDLCSFLNTEIQPLPFTQWQRGNPSTLGLVAKDVFVIECKYNNKTIHRIWFDQKHPDEYKIMAFNSTGKERLKNGGSNNPIVLYKAAYVVQPVLAAAIEYYFLNH